jgi:hypothetical protein
VTSLDRIYWNLIFGTFLEFIKKFPFWLQGTKIRDPLHEHLCMLIIIHNVWCACSAWVSVQAQVAFWGICWGWRKCYALSNEQDQVQMPSINAEEIHQLLSYLPTILQWQSTVNLFQRHRKNLWYVKIQHEFSGQYSRI